MGQSATDVVVVQAVRTPIGRGHPEKGYYQDVHPAALLGRTLRELIDRSGIAATEVDDVICGCAQQIGQQAANIGRVAWLHEGLPVETPATTLDRQCGSGQQAVNFAAAQIASGVADVIIACGVEHMGRVSFGVAHDMQERYGEAYTPEMLENHPIENQGIGAELLADAWGISRTEMDELAVRSHRLADEATTVGAFDRELVAVELDGAGRRHDQGIRPGTTPETLAQLPPAFREDGKVTAGNASQISDGAAAVLLTSREKADELGLTPRARITDQVAVGCDPVVMLEGPIPATHKLLERNAMTISDVDAFEVNEAFASVVLAWARAHGADIDRVNRRGGAMALGHPLGASGARLITTLLHVLEDEDAETGLVTMCCGGGLGTGTLITRV